MVPCSWSKVLDLLLEKMEQTAEKIETGLEADSSRVEEDYRGPHLDKHYKVAPEGYPFIVIGLILAGATVWLHWSLCALMLGFTAFVIYFFRNPKRIISQDAGVVICPADGEIIIDKEVEEKRFLHKRVRQVSIFMSPFNVHVNRIPVTGTIQQVSYNKGKYFAAYADKASLDNEQNALVIQNDKKDDILFIQIAGWLARRIVCYAKPGQVWKKGDIFGLIRFGSRVDIFLPLDYDVKVTLNQKVKAGETILARHKLHN